MDFDKKLITEVRKNEVLYNLLHKEYRRSDKKENIWKEIARRLHSNPERCKKRWKGLRDTYRKYRRSDYLRSENGAPEVNRKWKYFDLLSFLENYKDYKDPMNNKYTMEEEETSDVMIRINKTKAEDIISDTAYTYWLPPQQDEEQNLRRSMTPCTSSSEIKCDDNPPSSPKKRKKRDEDERIKKFCDFFNMATKHIADKYTEQEKDSTRMLFEMLAKKVKESNLPQSVVNEIECEVSTLIYGKLALYCS